MAAAGLWMDGEATVIHTNRAGDWNGVCKGKKCVVALVTLASECYKGEFFKPRQGM